MYVAGADVQIHSLMHPVVGRNGPEPDESRPGSFAQDGKGRLRVNSPSLGVLDGRVLEQQRSVHLVAAVVSSLDSARALLWLHSGRASEDAGEKLSLCSRAGTRASTPSDKLAGVLRSAFSFEDDTTCPTFVGVYESFVADDLACLNVGNTAVEPFGDAVSSARRACRLHLILYQPQRSNDLFPPGQDVEVHDWSRGRRADDVVVVPRRVEEHVEPRGKVADFVVVEREVAEVLSVKDEAADVIIVAHCGVPHDVALA